MLYDLGKMEVIRKYLDNWLWYAAIVSAACLGGYFSVSQ
jgi:hypothetical protein